MKELSQLIKAFVWFFLGAVFFKVIGFLFRFIISRMGVETYGTFYLGITIFDTITLIPTLGLLTGVKLYIAQYDSERDLKNLRLVISTAVKTTFLASILTSLALFFSSDFIAIKIFSTPELSLILKTLAVIIPFYVLTDVFLSITEGFKKIKYRIITTNIVESSTRTIATLVLLFSGFSLFSAVFGYVFSTMISFILAFIFVKKTTLLRTTQVLTSKIHKEILIFSWPIFIGKIIGIGFSRIDTLMLGALANITDVGTYNIAVPIVSFLSILPSSLISLFLPITTPIYLKDSENFKKFYQLTTKWLFLITVPLTLFFIFFSEKMIFLLFGQSYIDAAPALSILAIGYGINQLSLTSAEMFNILKKTKLNLVITSSLIILNVLLNYFLIPLFGISGAAIATSITLSGFAVICWGVIYYFMKVSPFSKNIVKILLSGFLALVVPFLILQLTISRVVIISSLLLFFASYFFLLIILHTLEKEDKEIIKKIRKKIPIRITSFEKLINDWL